MYGPHSSLLCVEPDEASVMYANLAFAASVLCFHADKHTIAEQARAERGAPAGQSGFVQEPGAEMQQNLLDVLGKVDEDHGKRTLFRSCNRRQEYRWICSGLPV